MVPEFVEILALFSEIDLMPGWFPHGLLYSSQEICSPSLFHKIAHFKMHLPLISNRDMVVDGHGYDLSENRTVLICGNSIDESPHCDVPKETDGYTRISIKSCYFLKLLSSGRVLFKQLMHVDLKMTWVPKWILNKIQTSAVPYDIVASLAKAHRRFKGSDWEPRVRNNRKLYGEVEKRLEEFVGKTSSTSGRSTSRAQLTNRTPGSKAEDAEEEEEDGVGGLTEGLGMRPEYEFCARDEATLTRLSSMCRKTAIVFVLASAVSLIQMVTESYFAEETTAQAPTEWTLTQRAVEQYLSGTDANGTGTTSTSGFGFESGNMYTVAAAFEYLVYAYFTKQAAARLTEATTSIGSDITNLMSGLEGFVMLFTQMRAVCLFHVIKTCMLTLILRRT